MEFAAHSNQEAVATGAVLRICRTDYIPPGPHFTPEAGSRFPIRVGKSASLGSGEFVEFYGHSAVMRLDDGTKWRLRRIGEHLTFPRVPDTSCSNWEVEALIE